MADEDVGFVIDEKTYAIPTLDSLDNDERMILFDYSGIVQEDFAPLEDESEEETQERNIERMRHPGFWPALMHIAYRRQNRTLKPEKIKALIGSTNYLDAMANVAADEEEDASPPALTSKPDDPSPSEKPLSSVSSGDESPNGSDERVRNLELTGTGG